MSSSIGENSIPTAHPSTTILMKGAAASADLLQQQQARQVLGNVGNSGVNIALINQKKEHFLNQVSGGQLEVIFGMTLSIDIANNINYPPLQSLCPYQELRKQQQQHLDNLRAPPTTADPQCNAIASSDNFGFSIYTDENSNGVKEDAGANRYSGPSRVSSEDSENLPPSSKMTMTTLLPSVQHGELANHHFTAAAAAPVVPVQGKCQLEDKSR